MTKSRDKLVEAVESAVQAHFGAKVIGHQVPLADTTERMIRAQCALLRHDEPGSEVAPLRSWIAELMRRDDDADLIAGFRREDPPDGDARSTRHWIGERFRKMCEDLFRDAGVEWSGPDEADGQGRML